MLYMKWIGRPVLVKVFPDLSIVILERRKGLPRLIVNVAEDPIRQFGYTLKKHKGEYKLTGDMSIYNRLVKEYSFLILQDHIKKEEEEIPW